ncbi:hypothetical protein [Sulfuriflexus sp.]|uniref:hypothetical protein n=1 Tax=Sulfuriflexus sp. TaxID=2015443 RepID=UPI0028CD95E9|nr:hypothetical protein [Sulfuriflexus sp.]MDT8405272.1 hypothetical protein [Sulfuriflexus sp.]
MAEDELEKLVARRDELRARLEAIENDYRQGLDRDTEEQALQLENAEVLAGIARIAAEELTEIQKRIAEIS